MPVLHSVMMLKVSEASRATSVTRAAAAAAAATSRRNSLSLQHALLHVQAAESAAAAAAAAPMTPHAVASSKTVASASSPRDPSSKLAAASPPLFAKQQPHGFAVSPLKLHPTIQTHMAGPASPASSTCSDSELSSSDASPVGKRSRDASASTGASTPKSASSSPKAMKANTGRWTDAEHKLFLKGLETFPYRAWKKIATLIKTRTVVQIRTHAQKYYQKLEKEEARMKDREHQLAQHSSCSKDSSAAHHLDASEYADLVSPKATSSGKKKSLLRKRKFTLDDDVDTDASHTDSSSSASVMLPSLPKRMMKEKKFPREKHMSPKQKAPVSGSNKFFGASFGSPEFGASAAPETAHRAVFSRGAAAMSKIPPHPLAFDDDDDASSENMILDFADDKSIVEYPFHHLDSSMDQSMAAMDNDDLLQLTDEESLDWFSTSSSEHDDDDGESAEELLKAAAAAAEPMDLVSVDADALEALDSSPLALGRYHFSPLYTDECLQFSDAASAIPPTTSTSTALLGACDAEDFLLTSTSTGDDDDDFVLDPEKFLSSYFNPSSTTATEN